MRGVGALRGNVAVILGDVDGFCGNEDFPRWVGSGQDRREGASQGRATER